LIPVFVIGIAALFAVSVLALVRWRIFESKWHTVRVGMSRQEIEALLGRPDDDRKLVNILSSTVEEDREKLMWEYFNGPTVYIVLMEHDEHLRATAVAGTQRRGKWGWEWIGFRND
jgi:hypothetical protein